MNTPRNRRILLIDDMPSIHEDFRKILAPEPAVQGLEDAEAVIFGRAAAREQAGFELDSAYQGREAAAMAELSIHLGRPYAMAFVDMRMPPGWDGVETIEHLWRIDPQLQVVICTAYSDHPWKDVLARLDVQDRLLIIKKPFDMIEVSQLARTLTAKWDLTRQAAVQMQRVEQAMRDLEANEAALRRSNEELEAFAHSMSHDLRSPLGIMRTFSGLLTKELTGQAGERALHFLSRIQANADVGERLVEGLLSLNRISRADMRVEPVNLTAMSNNLLAELRGNAPHRQVAVTVQDDMWADGDKRLLQIALRHLLDNAWKFTSARQQDAAIEFGRREGADGVPIFFLRDNGSGFDMAYADKLFRTFQRLHTASEIPGAGVGMVAVSRIIGRHGGRVWADSRPGAGATVYFTLPSAPGQALPDAESAIAHGRTP